MRKLWIAILVLLSAVFSSCTKESNEVSENKKDTTQKNSWGITAGGMEFKVEYNTPRRVYSIDNKDLDNDGDDEIIVLSVDKDEAGDQYMDYYNFDMIQVFTMDSARKNFVKIFTDTIDYGEELIYEDLEKNFKYQLLVKTNTGGNDVYASKGMFVYDFKPGNKLEMIKYMELGDPEIKDLNSDGNKEIVVTNSYWGTMPRPDIIYYTSDIYRMEGGELKRKNSDFKKYYDEKIDAARKRYDDEKSRLQKGEKIKPSEYPLYAAAIEMFVNYMSAENNPPIAAFWNSEKDFIKKNISEDQYTDLENFVTRITPVVENL